MSQQPLYTFDDTLQHLYRVEGSASDARLVALAKNAVLTAYRRIVNERNWTYFQQRGRITTDDDYNTGTVVYDHTGGANERQLTLTSGTWPTNAARGQVKISNVEYRVASRVSSSIVTLHESSNPGADVSSTSYHWWRDTYPLPVDFQSMGEMADHYKGILLTYVPAEDLLKYRISGLSPTQPTCFTIIADPDYLGQMAVVFDVPPDQVYNWEFVYRRKTLPLRTASYSTGTVSVSGTAVTGTSTAFTDAMVGSVIRFGDSSNVPTGLDGAYPFVEQRIITARGSATGLTIDSTLDGTYSGVKYSISDPIDLEEGAMYNAFLACCEAELARNMRAQDWQHREGYYRSALLLAKEADSRYFGPRSENSMVRHRLWGASIGDDVGA